MGNFLDTPIVEKETEVGEDSKVGLSYGLSAMQGWRSQMEDDHIQIPSIPEHPELSLFGVFDGHGGSMVAHHTAKHFPEHLLKTKQLSTDWNSPDFVAKAQAGFESALMSLDEEIRTLHVVESGQDQSGSTSVMTLLSPNHIICANTGDSRAVLSRGREAIPLSHDHKPYNQEEKQRIEAAGSHVKFNRVNGDLAVSRALGDFAYKRCSTVTAANQAVTAFPEMITEKRTSDDDFIVLACDGIWDVMSSQDVVDKVREMMQNGRPKAPPLEEVANEDGSGEPAVPPPQRPWDLGAVCEELINHCLGLGSRDNMSVIIVLLNKDLLLLDASPPETASS